jgi:hypothetical protein
VALREGGGSGGPFAQSNGATPAPSFLQVAQAHAHADGLEQRKKDLRRQAQDDIAADRAAAFARRAAAKEEAERAAAQTAEALRAKAALQQQREAADRAAQRERAKQLAAFQLAQMADKKRVFEGSHAEERDEAALAAASAAGLVADDYGMSVAAAAAAVVEAEVGKGRSGLCMERTLVRQNAASPAAKQHFQASSRSAAVAR